MVGSRVVSGLPDLAGARASAAAALSSSTVSHSAAQSSTQFSASLIASASLAATSDEAEHVVFGRIRKVGVARRDAVLAPEVMGTWVIMAQINLTKCDFPM